MPHAHRALGRPYLVAGLVWLVAAAAAGASGQVARLEPPVPQLILVGLTLLVLGAAVLLYGFRSWLQHLDLRAYVAPHLIRLVGIYLLILGGRGVLPRGFAVPAGWGDIVVAILALALLLSWPALGGRHNLLLGWNLLGLADMLFVAVTATRLALAEPASMAPMLRWPLSLLPTFLVPLIIASHVLLFWRLTVADGRD